MRRHVETNNVLRFIILLKIFRIVAPIPIKE